MKALVLKEYNHFSYDEVPTPTVGENDVLLAVKACGICGSDVHGMDGSTGRRQPPVIMGHEAAGEIVDVGSGVKNWKKGDRATFDSTIYCGQCWFCRRGQINLCDNRQVLGVSCDDYRRDGAFAEYVTVPAHILYRLPPGISFEQAAMVEALSIAVHAAGVTPIQLNDTAVVVGSGMIGLLVIQVLRAAGCGKIVAVDPVREKLELAGKLGANILLNPQEKDIQTEVMGLTRQRGADLAFEVVGNAAAMNTAIGCVRKGGTVTAVGNISPRVEFPLQQVVTRELRVQGTCASCGDYPACLEMMAAGMARIDDLVSATPPLREGAEWFHRLYNKEPGLMKVILRPGE
ncbi:alcohol dehydrogenase catalytic domain-containing protein [bacterium]|nr:alcohol dehydrogenase catalytic domain-containing protein [bacterium]